METTIHLRSGEVTNELIDKIQNWIIDKECADITIIIKDNSFDIEQYISKYEDHDDDWQESLYDDEEKKDDGIRPGEPGSA